MIRKEQFTLNVLTILDKYCAESSDLFETIKDDDALVTFKSKKFDFYFKILMWDEQAKGEKFIIEVFPTDRNNLSVSTYNVDNKNLDGLFKIWVELLSGYENIKNFPLEIDPIEKYYQETYFSEVKLIDQDADINPFSFEQQTFLNEKINNCINLIENFEIEDDESKESIKEILHTAIEIKMLLPKLPKNEWLKHLSKLWGKVSKLSFDLAKSIFIEIGTEWIKSKFHIGQ